MFLILLLGGRLILLPLPLLTLHFTKVGELLPRYVFMLSSAECPPNLCDHGINSRTEEGLTFSHHWPPSKRLMGANHLCSALSSIAFPQKLRCQASRNESVPGSPGKSYCYCHIIAFFKWSNGTAQSGAPTPRPHTSTIHYRKLLYLLRKGTLVKLCPGKCKIQKCGTVCSEFVKIKVRTLPSKQATI